MDELIVLTYLKDHLFINTDDSATLLQLNRDMLFDVLNKMSHPKRGILARKGHTKTATYYLSKSIAKDLIGKVCSPGGSSDSENMRFQDILQYFQRKENISRLFSLVKEWIICYITKVCRLCRINRKTSEKSCCTGGKGGDVTITTDLCDLYEQMDGLRLACRRERAVLDRRVEWLKQVTDLVSRMEGVCDEFQNLIEAQPRRAEPYDVQEHI